MLLLSFIVAYVFGREYAEGTAKNLLALPVGRQLFVLAKFVVAAAWWLVLVVAVLVEAFVIGAALGLPELLRGPGRRRRARRAAGRGRSRTCSCRWSRGSPSLGRGYMAPLGFALAMLALGNVFAKTGWAPWFPWSIVPLLIGMVGPTGTDAAAGSFVVLALTFVAGVAATIWQFVYADNDQ